LKQILRCRGWQLPLIMKPDIGQRGVGVALVRSLQDARRYFARNPGTTLAQVYHPGPHEAGVFYYRLPSEPSGRIFSITDKVFPEVVGDGRSTIEQLVWRHPRFRMQADALLSQLPTGGRDRIVMAGEPVRLTGTGNHCRGTLFRDGSHLLTPELTIAIDRVARRFDGFFFGRFDIRYRDVAAFRAGRDLAVVELNGITSESTNLYDPAGSLGSAYHTLIAQWNVLFQVADANRELGHEAAGALELWSAVTRHVLGSAHA
jgi:hypothetical protein